jgi:hypothetical protein
MKPKKQQAKQMSLSLKKQTISKLSELQSTKVIAGNIDGGDTTIPATCGYICTACASKTVKTAL